MCLDLLRYKPDKSPSDNANSRLPVTRHAWGRVHPSGTLHAVPRLCARPSPTHLPPPCARRLPRRARCPLPPALPPLRFPSDFSHSIILSIPMYSSQLQIYFCTAVAAQCTPTAKLGPTSEVLGRVRAGRLYSRWLRSPRAPSRSLCGRWLCCTFDGLMHVL